MSFRGFLEEKDHGWRSEDGSRPSAGADEGAYGYVDVIAIRGSTFFIATEQLDHRLYDEPPDGDQEGDYVFSVPVECSQCCNAIILPQPKEILLHPHPPAWTHRSAQAWRRVPFSYRPRLLRLLILFRRRKVTFITKEGDSQTFLVSDGDNLLDIAQANDLEMEGACGGSCACSTCHVIVEDSDMYDKMEEPDDDENDMLDLAFGLTETSRLGCQVKMSKELDGLVVRLPSMTRNLQASDFK